MDSKRGGLSKERTWDMRRPMCIVSGGFALGIVSCYLLAEKGMAYAQAVFAAAVLTIFISVYMMKNKSRIADKGRVPQFWLFLICFAVGICCMHSEYSEPSEYDTAIGKEIAVNGMVIQSEEKEDGEKYSFVVRTGNGEKVLVTMYKEKDEEIRDENGNVISDYHTITGRKVILKVSIELPQGKRNPGTFDYALYLRTKGIRSIATIGTEDIQIEDNAYGFRGRIINIIDTFKGKFDQRLTECIGEEKAGFILGMLFGEKGSLDEEVYEEFQRNGTAHILSVSGLHVGLVYMCIAKIARRKHSKIASIAVLCILLIYAALSLFSPSVTRAVMMIAINILAGLMHKRYDLLSAACTCAFIALLFNSYILFNTGFQLSYIAIISIAVISNVLKRFYNGIMLPIVSVQVGMMPVTAYLFNYVSLSAFIANIPVVFLAGLIIPAGMLMMVLLPFEMGLFNIAAQITATVCDMMIYMNELTYIEGRFTFDVVSPSVFFLVIYYFAVFGGLSETMMIWIKRRAYRVIAVFTVIAVLMGVSAQFLTNDGFEDADMVFVDVGQGDCLHVKTDKGNYLVDGGGSVKYDVGEKTLKPYLLKNGVKKIDIAFVSHLHTDHFAGIASLARAGMIEYICIFEGNKVIEDEIISQTGLSENKILYADRGDVINLSEDVHVEILAPDFDENEYLMTGEYVLSDNENDNSLIMKVSYDGFTVLMNGDIDAEGEKKLIDDIGIGLESTLLKAAHHGSKYSSCDEFIHRVSPEYMVFQVGKNNYGHPDKSVIEKCLQKGIMVYRNDEDGAIGICDAGKNVKIVTMQ